MTNAVPAPSDQPIACPHCKREFDAKLIVGPGDEPQGYKCPHCRLFVAIDRVREG